FASRRRHTRFDCDWSSDVCSSDLALLIASVLSSSARFTRAVAGPVGPGGIARAAALALVLAGVGGRERLSRRPVLDLGEPLADEIGRASCRERGHVAAGERSVAEA